ncbi:hypothetical protein QQX98_013371 [Neonectria punicea]|uniref:Uncharacterized protein n=1 Tax=Neonectria punicea TaxID=979145 RepID=A0ABR1GGK8_9HYPO
MITWNKEGTLLYFQGRPFAMETIRYMIRQMTMDVEDLLWDGLMFWPRDDLTQTQRGQSFIHANGLVSREREMLQNLIAGPFKKEFLDSQDEWKWPRVQQYLRKVKRFQELLLLLVHLTNHPLRGTEITGLRLVNGINRDRSLFIINSEVVLISQYHKSLAHFDSLKVILRILPSRIG